MSITGNSKKNSNGFWKGTCSLCGSDITRRNSLATGEKVAYGQRQPRTCRDEVTCLGRKVGELKAS